METLPPVRPLAALKRAAAAALLLAAGASAFAAAPVEREFEDAVRAFRSGRTSEAFGRFIELANRGDVDAARIALFMHGYGPVLYGKQWEAGPQDVAYWTNLVRNSGTSGRPLPEYPPTVLYPSSGKGRAKPVAPAAPTARPAAPELANVAKN